PACEIDGVHDSTLLTGFPVVGSGGVIEAPGGRPATFSVTVSPASASDACTVKLKGTPVGVVIVLPHTGCENVGGVFTCGPSSMKKSTAIFPTTFPSPLRSSTVTCVE